MTSANWVEKFKGLASLNNSIKQLLVDRGAEISIKKNTIIFGPGKASEGFLFLIKGKIRVQQISESGREIVLYRINAGESCVLTTACLLAYEDYYAESIAESDVVAVILPRQVFDQLVGQSEEFRKFVFSAYSKRITDLFLIIDEIAFKRMDIRLAQKLLKICDETKTIHSTHQKLALELGTAREVITRILQDFSRRKWILQSRGIIKLINKSELLILSETIN